ncbi:uncharacterized protein LOC131306587 isoform X2 [Rhododendron vialii]|uniref:uncharacterized protein LOC131306587 isoform X2 n=1 Tax=Rhododendron vialii TaxID=182163 RepID=UPI00265DC836|nr:uncharacterized protein LOC131306587 isoform X2 [Rhododendron vialii]
MAYAAARLVVSFQTFDSDMSTDKDAVLLPSVMKAPNLRSGPTSSPTFTSWPPRTAAIPAPCPQNPATRLPPFGAPAKTWCRWHRKVPASLRGDDIVQGNKKLLLVWELSFLVLAPKVCMSSISITFITIVQFIS